MINKHTFSGHNASIYYHSLHVFGGGGDTAIFQHVQCSIKTSAIRRWMRIFDIHAIRSPRHYKQQQQPQHQQTKAIYIYMNTQNNKIHDWFSISGNQSIFDAS